MLWNGKYISFFRVRLYLRGAAWLSIIFFVLGHGLKSAKKNFCEKKMAKIFVIGTGPLLEKGVRKIGGHCLRTWHFVSPLLEDGHQISLVTLPIPNRDTPPEKFRESSEKRKVEGLVYTAVLKEEPSFLYPFLSREIERFRPDCILGINSHPSGVAARVAGAYPLWSDLNGWAMAEGQTRARLDQDDCFLSYFWRDERDAGRRSDRFSTVSKNQKLALLGELAALGRMNQFTFDYRFADVIENAVNPLFSDLPGANGEPQLRGKRIPQNAFVVLWSGGFNTWTNVNLLYEALARAMEKNERIYFVSTGGSIDGHDEITYTKFHKLLAASPHRKRFILLGWIEAELLPIVYSESDVGINVDAENYETLFGARNRITNMLAAGLPVITTLGTEISITIKEQRLGRTIPLNDSDAMAEAILEMAENSNQTREMAHASRQFAIEQYSYPATTKPMREWAREPRLAPDNLEKTKQHPDEKNLLALWLSELEKTYALLQDRDVEKLLIAERDLALIREKPVFKLYKNIKGVLKKK